METREETDHKIFDIYLLKNRIRATGHLIRSCIYLDQETNQCIIEQLVAEYKEYGKIPS